MRGQGGWGPAAPGMTWVCQGLLTTLPQNSPGWPRSDCTRGCRPERVTADGCPWTVPGVEVGPGHAQQAPPVLQKPTGRWGWKVYRGK